MWGKSERLAHKTLNRRLETNEWVEFCKKQTVAIDGLMTTHHKIEGSTFPAEIILEWRCRLLLEWYNLYK